MAHGERKKMLLDNIMEMNLIVNKTFQSISVGVMLDGKLSVANADNLMDGRWWISRVNVQDNLRGLGIGSTLLNRMIKEILTYGETDIIVAPGGYNQDTNKQFHFYEKNGFVKTNEDGLLTYKNELCQNI